MHMQSYCSGAFPERWAEQVWLEQVLAELEVELEAAKAKGPG